MSSKSGSTTSAQSIPDWLRDPTIRNLDRAEQAASIGYQPYFGPDVAAFNPTQNQGFQNTQNALASFGMAPRGSQVQTGMPPTINAGGVSGYASSPLYEQAVAELAVRDPNQMARYGALYNPNINPNNLTTALNNQQKPYGFDTDGGWEPGPPPTQDFAKNAEFYARNPNVGDVMRNIHSAMYSGPIGQFAKYAQDPWAKNQDHNFIASTFGMSPNDSAYSENVVNSTATPNGAIATPVPSMNVVGTPLAPIGYPSNAPIATPVPSMNVVGTPLAPIGYPSNPIDGSLDTSNLAISNAMAADAAGNAAAAATGNYGSITDFGGVGPSVSGGGTSSGDAGVSGANSESSHSADGNNSGSESGGFGGGTGDSEGDDGWYKGGKVTKNRLKGMNPPGPDDGYGALQDGEYVVSKKAVDKYGTGLLGKINSGKMSKKRKG